jgi:hypothetical protein
MKSQKNIIFIGRNAKGEKSEPPAHINTATGTIELPAENQQHKGFYHQEAANIIRLFPALYKPIITK